jgi:hypothetical protein
MKAPLVKSIKRDVSKICKYTMRKDYRCRCRESDKHGYNCHPGHCPYYEVKYKIKETP